MKSHRRVKLLERTMVLILLGVLMGAIGGAAIGFVTGRASSAATGQ